MAGTNQFPQQPSGMPPMGQPTMSTGRIPGGMPPTGRPGAPMSGQQPEKKKKSKKPLIIVIIVFLIRSTETGLRSILYIRDKTKHRLVIYASLTEWHYKIHMLYFRIMQKSKQKMLRIYCLTFQHACFQDRKFYQAVS